MIKFADWFEKNKERLSTTSTEAALFEAWKVAKSSTSKEFVEWHKAIHITAHTRGSEFNSWVNSPD